MGNEPTYSQRNLIAHMIVISSKYYTKHGCKHSKVDQENALI